MIVNPPVRVPDCPSVLVTTTLYVPAEPPPGRVNVHVIRVDELTTTLVAVTVAPPVSCTVGVVPTTKFVPARLVIDTVVPRNPVFGVMEVTVGAGAK